MRCLPLGEVRVWLAALDERAPVPSALERLLSEDERARAARLTAPEARVRFVLCRGLLRALAGRLLGEEPAALRFEYSDKGRPELAGQKTPGALRFSLSHTRGAAVFGFCLDAAIGVDIERLRPLPEADRIARSFFSGAERDFLAGLPPGRRDEAFFRLWTMKEALGKARGGGLAAALEGAELAPAPDLSAAALMPSGGISPAEAARWTLRSLDAGPGLAASLALEGTLKELNVSRWEDDPSASLRPPR